MLLGRDLGIKKIEDDMKLIISNFLFAEIKMIQAFPSTYCLLLNEVKVTCSLIFESPIFSRIFFFRIKMSFSHDSFLPF